MKETKITKEEFLIGVILGIGFWLSISALALAFS